MQLIFELLISRYMYFCFSFPQTCFHCSFNIFAPHEHFQVQFACFSIRFYDFRLLFLFLCSFLLNIYMEGSITKNCVSHQNQLRRQLNIFIYFECSNMWNLLSFCLQQKQQNTFDVFILSQKFNAMMYELFNFLLACSISGDFSRISKFSNLKINQIYKKKNQMLANLIID